MNRFTFILMLVLAALLASVPNAHAQAGKCYAHEALCPQVSCPGADTLWHTDNIPSAQLLRCGYNCYVKIFFCYRVVCGDTCDMFIDHIQKTTDPHSCDSCSTPDIFEAAVDYLLKTHNLTASRCSPDFGQCFTTIRVMSGGCWRQNYAWESWDGWTVCEPINCCGAIYKVCYDSSGQHYQQLSTLGVDSPCEGECEPICGHFPTYPTDLKPALGGADHATQQATVRPNPTSGITTFSCNAGTTGDAVLDIYNLNGQQVRQLHGMAASDGSLSFAVDMKDLPSGTYQYRISAGTKAIAEGSFTVAK